MGTNAAQMLGPASRPRSKRETCNTFVVVLERHGEQDRDQAGQTFRTGEPDDIMVLPNFLWRRHINTGKSDAILYTVSDSALMKEHRSIPGAGKG